MQITNILGQAIAFRHSNISFWPRHRCPLILLFFTWHTDFPWATRGLTVLFCLFFFFFFFLQLAEMLNLYCCFSLAFPLSLRWGKTERWTYYYETLVQCSSVAQSCPTLCDPMDCSTPGFLVQPCPSPAPEVTQTHVHRVSDAIQPSHPLSSPSPPAFNLS